MDANEVVSSFLAANVAGDLDRALELVTDDCEYDNVPMGAVHGPDGIRQTLGPFLAGASELDWQVRRQVADATTVMNERVDRFRMGDRWVELPVMGVFEVRDGRIALWRDYFDLATFTGQMAPPAG